MRSALTVAAACAAALTLAACGHARPFPDYCHALSSAMCERFATCHVEGAPPPARCADVTATLCACTGQDLAAGRHTYHPSVADACVAQVRSSSCEDFVAHGVKTGVCLDVLGDTQAKPISCDFPKAQRDALPRR